MYSNRPVPGAKQSGRHRKPQAGGWLSLLLAAPLPAVAGLAEVAGQLADAADTQGVVDPPPTVPELVAATGLPKVTVRRVLTVLVAAGWQTGPHADGVVRLTLPHRPPIEPYGDQDDELGDDDLEDVDDLGVADLTDRIGAGDLAGGLA